MARATSQRPTGTKARRLARNTELKRTLETRRRQTLSDVRGRLRDARAEGSNPPPDVLDTVEASQVDGEEDIALALFEMKAETLGRIDEALSHLRLGTYGQCVECGEEIAESRLRALPFAARCRDCEETREMAAPSRGDRGQPRRVPEASDAM